MSRVKGSCGPGGPTAECWAFMLLLCAGACSPPNHGQYGGRAPASSAVLPPVEAGVAPVAGDEQPGGAPTTTPRLVALELVRALPIERWDNFQPSGLLWHEGKLLTVSDKHDHEIFELVIDEHEVRVMVHQTITIVGGSGDLDLEGICSDGAGGLLLVSEEQVRILRVRSDSVATWFSPPLKALGARVGLFQLANATLEGVAYLPGGRLLLAAERSERGLLELSPGGRLEHASVWSLPTTLFNLPAGRLPDFSDLATHGDALFALIRNGHLVVRLRRHVSGWQEHEAWTFERTENDPRYAYLERRYGVAEGLALDDNFVYVVLDNNGDARVANRRDIRPQLFIFRRPPE